ncbi:hypothetical protein [Brachybacterium sp. YJGR34]|uniref:hypothetical protein n=1 Tax=Brachybacterium sp. YJGR34 TaxID=2059911 RepID=UPI000E0C9B86|nr:hypothetical protein [Brachybacterium sp. YJGR34]
MRSDAELLTLQALRLAGYADEEGVADRALLRAADLRAVLAAARDAGHVESMSVGGSSGWLPTEHGLEHLRGLLAAEADRDGGRPVLDTAAARFEEINGPFVETVSRWQLRSTAAGSAEDAPEELLAPLGEHGAALRSVLADLVAIRPRFGRYPAQYDLALRRARTEGLGWVTGVGILSCHVVWAELHQDLLSSRGCSR